MHAALYFGLATQNTSLLAFSQLRVQVGGCLLMQDIKSYFFSSFYSLIINAANQASMMTDKILSKAGANATWRTACNAKLFCLIIRTVVSICVRDHLSLSSAFKNFFIGIPHSFRPVGRLVLKRKGFLDKMQH